RPPAEGGARGSCLRLPDANAPDLGALLEVFPLERVGQGRAELVVERDGIVVVHQGERLAGLERLEPAEDGGVLLAGRDLADVETAADIGLLLGGVHARASCDGRASRARATLERSAAGAAPA